MKRIHLRSRAGDTRPDLTTYAAPIGRLRALYRFFADRDASLVGKLMVFAAAFYVVFPADAIPDMVPILGWLDDLGVAAFALAYLSKVITRYRQLPPVEPVPRA